MNEQTRIQPASLDPAGSSDDLQDAGDGGLVTVSHGVHGERLPAGNMTVGEIRRRYADRLDLDPLAQAEIDGRNVDESAVVRAGQHLLFANHAGEKGVGSSTSGAVGMWVWGASGRDRSGLLGERAWAALDSRPRRHGCPGRCA